MSITNRKIEYVNNKHNKSKKNNYNKSYLLDSQKMYAQVMNEFPSIMPSNFPKLKDSVNCKKLLNQIKTEDVIIQELAEGEMRATFTLRNDAPADFTRAIQEEEVLKVRLKNFDKYKNKVVDLPSFWDVWNRPNSPLPKLIIRDRDPNEAKWKYAIPNKGNLGYKVATNFMPGYARAMYEYYGAKRALDPCAGWGDRLTGAICAKGLEKYVGFDPNLHLRKGYTNIMKYGGHELTKVTSDELHFNNTFEIHSKPFEVGILGFPNESFDFAFTSPPFFDYEMYNPDNPEYNNWYDEFYTPLFVQVYRVLKPGSYFGIHIGDTTAGKIMDFLFNEVPKITKFRYDHSIGLKGMMSNKLRTVWMFYKPIEEVVKQEEPPKPDLINEKKPRKIAVKSEEDLLLYSIVVPKKNQYKEDGVKMFKCGPLPQKDGTELTYDKFKMDIEKNKKEELYYFAVPFGLKRSMLKDEMVRIVKENIRFM